MKEEMRLRVDRIGRCPMPYRVTNVDTGDSFYVDSNVPLEVENVYIGTLETTPSGYCYFTTEE